VSIPGVLSGRSVKLFSGQVVPVIEVPNTRGLYGWKVNTLVQAAIQTVQAQATEAQEESIRRTLGSFLSRIYYDLRNLGTTSQDRALNVASTNAFQAASTRLANSEERLFYMMIFFSCEKFGLLIS
jgi:hypothetical protein